MTTITSRGCSRASQQKHTFSWQGSTTPAAPEAKTAKPVLEAGTEEAGVQNPQDTETSPGNSLDEVKKEAAPDENLQEVIQETSTPLAIQLRWFSKNALMCER
jgi:predicted flap endonuclease-1-like 5' DNA nuclease